METLRCRECIKSFSIDEICEAKDTCPSCGKKTSWVGEPELVGF